MSTISPDHRTLGRRAQDAHRYVLFAVQQSLAERWDDDRPRIAIVDHDGPVTVYVSTLRDVGPDLRADIRVQVRQAVAEFDPLGRYADVVFLRREKP